MTAPVSHPNHPAGAAAEAATGGAQASRSPAKGPTTRPEKWWVSATGYQVYPRSFCDSNGDGIGDIPGIISKLDYLEDLGVGFIWLSPVYASPMADNGYDISDYRAIAPEFGTLKDMDRLIAEARARDIRIVMDLVVNHTSSEHAWFRRACAAPESAEHDYYIWRPAAADGGSPSDLRACFGGPAWHWVEAVGKYYLGYFSAGQPDLNWQNPQLRAEIYEMMIWWLDRGIGGFRMDVISLIGKDVDAGVLEEGSDLHRFLQEMHREALAGRDIVTIGESWSVSPETAPLYCGPDRGELDMVFQFNHVTQAWDETFGKFRPRPFDLVRFKQVLAEWQDALADDGWSSLFLSNHDLPRQVSVYGDDGAHRVRSAKLLAIVMHLLKGTPFVYQGEEIGMTNTRFDRIEQFRDAETLGNYADLTAQGLSYEAFIAGANAQGRDNARTPMQWTDAPGAGFTSGTPWIDINPNAQAINVEADRKDPDGVFATYQHLIALRQALPVLRHGTVTFEALSHPQVLAYAREWEGQKLIVIANVSDRVAEFDVPDRFVVHGQALAWTIGPRASVPRSVPLQPYEAVAVLAIDPA